MTAGSRIVLFAKLGQVSIKIHDTALPNYCLVETMMFRFILLASCIGKCDNSKSATFILIFPPKVAFASAKVAKQKLKIVVGEPEAQGTHVGEVSVGLASGHSKSYSSGAELTSLAHTSALQAKSAVQNQNTAGSQAAFGAKSSLAQAALGAAATAQAALVGKQVIVQGLEHQLHDAEHQLQAEIAQYQQTEHAAQAAQEAAQQAQQQVAALTAALAATQGGAQHAAKAAAEAAGAAAAQHAMIHEAKQRVAHLREELHNALAGLQETEISAQKAAAAAHIAQSNAAAAANDVATNAAQSEIEGHGYEQAAGGEYHH